MANKIVTVYTCTSCDAQFSKWNGRCLECGAWGTLKQNTVEEGGSNSQKDQFSAADVVSLDKIKSTAGDRIKINISEIDRVLGGGFIPGSLILLTGEPGIGKSTILAQIAEATAHAVKASASNDVFYVSGEESAVQVKERFVRLKCSLGEINFISETNVEKIIARIKKDKPALVVIDSIQTVYSSYASSEAGSLNQIRAATVQFLETAKNLNVIIILTGHITKDGQVAGPKMLEHIVDTVIYLESSTNQNYRILRASKNRFGSINEIGIFEMTNSGFLEIKNPSAIFLDQNKSAIPGSVVSCLIEGSRPFLVEIQALVTKTSFGYPQRKASGFDLNRLQVLTAVINKRSKINLNNQDVILNVVGGLKINEPALDLAVCLAIASSLLNQPVDKKTVVLGEVGLGGEARNISLLENRLKEAANLGYREAIIPDVNLSDKHIKIIKIKNISALIDIIT